MLLEVVVEELRKFEASRGNVGRRGRVKLPSGILQPEKVKDLLGARAT